MIQTLINNRITKYAILFILVVAALFLAKKTLGGFITGIKETNFDNNGDVWENEMALKYYAALEADWYNEDENALFQLAYQSKGKSGLVKIDKAYKKKYGHTVSEKLAELLSSADLNIFYTNLGN